jgi:hypothetical protein
MQVFPHMFAAVVVDTMVTARPPTRAILARSVASAYAATAVSIFIAFCCSLLIPVATGGGIVPVLVGAILVGTE